MSPRQYAVQVVAGLALTAAGLLLMHALVTLPEYPRHGLDAGGRFALTFVLLLLGVGVVVALGATLWRGGGAVAVVVMGAAGVLAPVAMFDPAPDFLLLGLRDAVVQACALSGLACLLATTTTVAWLTQGQRSARPRRS